MSTKRIELSDGHTANFKFYLHEDELRECRNRYIEHVGRIDMHYIDWFFTKYFMDMHQSTLNRVRAVVRNRPFVSRKEIRDMIVKFDTEYSKSHDYEFLGIECDRRIRQFVEHICDHWLKKKTNIKVLDD